MEEVKDIFTINGEELTKEQFEEKTKEIKETNDVKLVSLNEKTHKTRLLG